MYSELVHYNPDRYRYTIFLWLAVVDQSVVGCRGALPLVYERPEQARKLASHLANRLRDRVRVFHVLHRLSGLRNRLRLFATRVTTTILHIVPVPVMSTKCTGIVPAPARYAHSVLTVSTNSPIIQSRRGCIEPHHLLELFAIREVESRRQELVAEAHLFPRGQRRPSCRGIRGFNGTRCSMGPGELGMIVYLHISRCTGTT